MEELSTSALAGYRGDLDRSIAAHHTGDIIKITILGVSRSARPDLTVHVAAANDSPGILDVAARGVCFGLCGGCERDLGRRVGKVYVVGTNQLTVYGLLP